MVKGAAKAAAGPSATGVDQAASLPRMGTGLNVAGNPVDSIENVQHVGWKQLHTADNIG